MYYALNDVPLTYIYVETVTPDVMIFGEWEFKR